MEYKQDRKVAAKWKQPYHLEISLAVKSVPLSSLSKLQSFQSRSNPKSSQVLFVPFVLAVPFTWETFPSTFLILELRITVPNFLYRTSVKAVIQLEDTKWRG